MTRARWSAATPGRACLRKRQRKGHSPVLKPAASPSPPAAGPAQIPPTQTVTVTLEALPEL